MNTTIYVITHKKFAAPDNSMYVPIHAGSALTAATGYLRDDTGDNISIKNPNYCELTAMYWLYKNVHNIDNIGICHYRRYLVANEPFESLLERYDMLTTKLLTLEYSYYVAFGKRHHIRDLDLTRDAVAKLYPEYLYDFDILVNDCHTYFGNIMLTKKVLYDKYCKWLFSILFEVEKHVDMTGYDGYSSRLYGFLSEFLQTVYIRHNSLNVCECMVGMIGEKAETKQIITRIADFFLEGDFCGAKDYFYSCYQKRPDILMEASDVHGELKLCMQIISTCSFEFSNTGTCILDYEKDYNKLVAIFTHLNHIIKLQTYTTISKDDENFLSSGIVSTDAINIAKQLFGSQDR